MIEQFRQMVLSRLEAATRQSADAVLNLQFFQAATLPNGQTAPGTTIEAIGAQAVSLNARTRALWEAAGIVNDVFKTLSSPDQKAAEKAANGAADTKGPYA